MPMPPGPPPPPPPPYVPYVPPPPDIQYAPPEKASSGWFKKYGGLIFAGILITGGIGTGVVSGLAYARYHNLKNPQKKIGDPPIQINEDDVKKEKNIFIIFGSVSVVLLIIGIIIGFVSIRKLKNY